MPAGNFPRASQHVLLKDAGQDLIFVEPGLPFSL